MKKKKIIILTGTTCTGKTKLSIQLAKKFPLEVINIDSTQFYEGMNIGTNKITKKEMANIPHYLLSFLTPKENFNVAKFKILAQKTINNIYIDKNYPLLVGSSGLYILSLLYPYVFTSERSEEFAKNFEFTSNNDLYITLKNIDSDEAEKLHPNNRRKVLRALEIFHETGKTKTELLKHQNKDPEYDYLLIELGNDSTNYFLNVKDRINDEFANGLINEVKAICKQYPNFNIYNSFKIMGYKEVYDHLYNNISVEDTKTIIFKKTKLLIKKQKTFYKNKLINKYYFDISDKDTIKKIYLLIKNFINY